MAEVQLRPRDVPRLGRVIEGTASGSDVNTLVAKGLVFPLPTGQYVASAAAQDAYFHLMRQSGTPSAEPRDLAAPAPGTRVHHPRFGGGATLEVKWINEAKPGRAATVAVRIHHERPEFASKPHRVWSLETWHDFVESARRAEEEKANG